MQLKFATVNLSVAHVGGEAETAGGQIDGLLDVGPLILVRPDGLLAAASLVLRFAPDRRRRSGDVLPGAAAGSRTVLLSVRGSICSFPISLPGLPKHFF